MSGLVELSLTVFVKFEKDLLLYLLSLRISTVFVHLVLLNLGRISVRDVRQVTYAVQDLTRIRVLLDNSFKSLEIILEKSVGKVMNTISFGTINVKIVQLVINVVLLHLNRFHVKTKVITVTEGR